MPKGLIYDDDLLKLIFNGTSMTVALAINATSSPITNLFVALHTADPSTTAGSGTQGTQNASEATYTGYGRVAVARTSGAWSVTTNSVVPIAAITFGAGSGGSGTVTHWSVGTSTSGASYMLYSGTVTPNIVTGNGITPILTTATTVTET